MRSRTSVVGGRSPQWTRKSGELDASARRRDVPSSRPSKTMCSSCGRPAGTWIKALGATAGPSNNSGYWRISSVFRSRRVLYISVRRVQAHLRVDGSSCGTDHGVHACDTMVSSYGGGGCAHLEPSVSECGANARQAVYPQEEAPSGCGYLVGCVACCLTFYAADIGDAGLTLLVRSRIRTL